MLWIRTGGPNAGHTVVHNDTHEREVFCSVPCGAVDETATLVIGAGAMGLFPCYYSLAQEVSPRHLGKATGLLAAIGWLVASPFQKIFGRLIDQTGSFDTGLALAGCAPAVSLVILLVCWPAEKKLRPHGTE